MQIFRVLIQLLAQFHSCAFHLCFVYATRQATYVCYDLLPVPYLSIQSFGYQVNGNQHGSICMDVLCRKNLLCANKLWYRQDDAVCGHCHMTKNSLKNVPVLAKHCGCLQQLMMILELTKRNMISIIIIIIIIVISYTTPTQKWVLFKSFLNNLLYMSTTSV